MKFDIENVTIFIKMIILNTKIEETGFVFLSQGRRQGDLNPIFVLLIVYKLIMSIQRRVTSD